MVTVVRQITAILMTMTTADDDDNYDYDMFQIKAVSNQHSPVPFMNETVPPQEQRLYKLNLANFYLHFHINSFLQ
jgi:hypothetical protein